MTNCKVFCNNLIILPKSSFFEDELLREAYSPIYDKINTWLNNLEKLKESKESYYTNGYLNLVDFIGTDYEFPDDQLYFADIIIETLKVFHFKVDLYHNKIIITCTIIKYIIYEQISDGLDEIIEQRWRDARQPEQISCVSFTLPSLPTLPSKLPLNIELKIIYLEMIGEVRRLLEVKLQKCFLNWPFIRHSNLVKTLPHNIHELIESLNEQEIDLDLQTQELVEKIGYIIENGTIQKIGFRTKPVEF